MSPILKLLKSFSYPSFLRASQEPGQKDRYNRLHLCQVGISKMMLLLGYRRMGITTARKPSSSVPEMVHALDSSTILASTIWLFITDKASRK